MMRVKAWLVHSNFARFGWQNTWFGFGFYLFIMFTTNKSSADGWKERLWCTHPGFDPRRVHFVIFLIISGQSNAIHHPTPIMYHQRPSTGCPAGQISRFSLEGPWYTCKVNATPDSKVDPAWRLNGPRISVQHPQHY